MQLVIVFAPKGCANQEKKAVHEWLE